ncbi:PAS domain-containing sensor histidine kinase [Nostoc sp.]|uniref:PAS domain-containing sensor histidine kinase n=1 Tax=Nostoc sp. TaxID=1180 RepID=UPI003FA5AFB4
MPIVEHIRETSKPFLEAYQSGLETGDLEFAAYCAFTYCLQLFIVGKELVEVEHEMATYCEAIYQIKQTTSLTWTQIFQQSVLNLMGCSVNPSRLVGESYNEENRLPHHEIQDVVILFLVHLNKLILCYLFSEYVQASENAAIAESHVIRVSATPLVLLHYFYSSLARLAIFPRSSAQAQEKILKNVAISQEQMKQWATYAPMNYLHKYHLVEAEIARVLGQLLEAEEFYEQAIQGARDNEYLQEEALAYELAAKFYLSRGRKKIAQTYMKEAHYCYARWGAVAKVKDLEIRQNNTTIPIEVWGTPVFDEQGNVAYAIVAFEDITERKKAENLLANYNRTLEQQVAQRTAALQQSEAELRSREQELRLITDALPALISYVDANRCYQFINRTHEVWFSRNRDEILGKSVHELLGETVYQRVEPSINQVFEGQTVTLEAEIPSSLGRHCISATLIPDFDRNAQVRGFYSLITDISEQRNAALRERKRAEHASILEERNRMAREIHDTLAQSFTGILLQVGAAMQVLADDREATQEHLEMIDELARIGLSEARRSVAALRPQMLSEGNLQSALHRLVTQMRASTDTIVICEIKGTAYSLPTEVENHLLRIGQEALTNAIKYADAAEIRIELVYDNAQCILRVKDNGRGFGVATIPSVGGFGLLGMSERAEHLGAQLSIQSQPGQGTEIVVIVNRE